MKKILTNKKGFTLIELLAVIVVLAIIMVIATQQVNGTIKKSRANTFVESMQTVVKSAKMVWAQENKLDQESLENEVDLSGADYELKVDGTCIKLTGKGKFTNMDLSKVTLPSNYTVIGKNTLSVSVDVDGTEKPCSITTTPSSNTSKK